MEEIKSKLTSLPEVSKENDLVNHIFNMVYYINMEKDTDRNDNILNLFKAHNITNYTKVQGRCVDYKQVDPMLYRNFNERDEKYVNGALGCRQGHVMAIQDARDNGYERILILEDDIDGIDWYWSDLVQVNIAAFETFDMMYFGGLVEQHYRNQITLGHAYGLSEIIYDDILAMAGPSGMEIDNFYAKIIQHMSRNDRPGGQYVIKKIEPFNCIVQRHDKFGSNIRQIE